MIAFLIYLSVILVNPHHEPIISINGTYYVVLQSSAALANVGIENLEVATADE